jgi:hypothetical protein
MHGLATFIHNPCMARPTFKYSPCMAQPTLNMVHTWPSPHLNMVYAWPGHIFTQSMHGPAHINFMYLFQYRYRSLKYFEPSLSCIIQSHHLYSCPNSFTYVNQTYIHVVVRISRRNSFTIVEDVWFDQRSRVHEPY